MLAVSTATGWCGDGFQVESSSGIFLYSDDSSLSIIGPLVYKEKNHRQHLRRAKFPFGFAGEEGSRPILYRNVVDHSL